MKILHIIRRAVPKSILWQEQAYNEAKEVEHIEVFPERELTKEECRNATLIQAWASRQAKNIYRELNPAVKEAKQ